MSLQVSSADDQGLTFGPSRCARCGGSGMLRVDDQRYRTCLDCLGQGRLLPMAGEGLFFRIVSVASASGAR